jgi:hypothetical protein
MLIHLRYASSVALSLGPESPGEVLDWIYGACIAPPV